MTLSKTIIGQHAAIASEQPLATLAGRNALLDGGNAFDAAVATSFALAVTFHSAGGIGGDFFGMFYEAKTGKVHCLNASGWSPSGLTLELVKKSSRGIPSFGPLSSVVPGMVAGVWEMHRKFGSKEFRDLLRPSIEFASKGFPAGEGLCRAVADAYARLSPEAKQVFAPSGKPTIPGELLRQEALARVISDVASNGADAFYSGWPADRIASSLTSLGISCEAGDFRDYKPEWVDPLSLDYRGTTVYEVPPNSMGATNLLILKLLSEAPIAKFGPLSKQRIGFTIKAALAAYARRDEMLGDPRFTAIDIDSFLSGETPSAVPRSVINSGDTTAFSITDSDGNMVSGIQSLFNQFGSRVFIPECGIVLNNRASGFSTSGPNMLEPHKRPLHTLSSMILVRRDQPYLAIGTSGGDHRPLQHAQFVTNSVDYSLSAEENVAHQRFLWGGGMNLLIEEGYELPDDGKFEIRTLPMPGRTGVCQAVEVSGEYKKAVCDVRGDGIPAAI